MCHDNRRFYFSRKKIVFVFYVHLCVRERKQWSLYTLRTCDFKYISLTIAASRLQNFFAESRIALCELGTTRDTACGVCLLTTDAAAAQPLWNSAIISAYGRQYHAPCANLWHNRVSRELPSVDLQS